MVWTTPRRIAVVACATLAAALAVGLAYNHNRQESPSSQPQAPKADMAGMPADVRQNASQEGLGQQPHRRLTGTVEDGVRVIYLTARQFSFDPARIAVQQGERVRIIATSEDVVHGFQIPEYGIDRRIEPGQETIIEFDASQNGLFKFRCSVYCGTGHSNMAGDFIVEPQ